MKGKCLLIGVLCICGLSGICAEKLSIEVAADPRVELMAVVFRLAGNPEYRQSLVPEYNKRITEYFQPFAAHPVVAMAKELRSKHDVSYDAVSSMAVHLSSIDNLKLIVSINEAVGLDGRWPRERIPEFLTKLSDFAVQSKFKEFYQSNRGEYEKYEELLKNRAAELGITEWAEKTFKPAELPPFKVIPFMTAGGNYGPEINYGPGKYCFYAIVSMQSQPAKGIDYILVHDFLHSLVNPLVDRYFSRLKPFGNAIFPYVEEQMRRMTYNSPHTMICESFVRAGTAVYYYDKAGEMTKNGMVKQEEIRGFLWTGDLVQSILDARSKGGADWAFEQGINDYAGALSKYQERELPKLEDQKKKLMARTPKIVSLDPPDKAGSVDPNLKEIKIKFDRPMQPSWSLVKNNPDDFPEITGITFDKECVELTVRVKLKPGKFYQIFLNTGHFQDFMSRGGQPLESFNYTFTTGDSR